jgi:hypothetical protein
MERQILVTEANRMTNHPQKHKRYKKAPQMGLFIPKIGLSEMCQKKTRFWEFIHFKETHKTIVNVGGRGGIRAQNRHFLGQYYPVR